MPELPEVETVRITLAPALGMRVAATWASGEKLRGKPVRVAALAPLVGQRLVSIARRGKYLVIELERHGIIAHLGMSGRLLWSARKGQAPRAPHTHAVLMDAPGNELRFVDPRRFGQFDVVPRAALATDATLRALGADPIGDGLAPGYLAEIAARRKVPIKLLLLDQHAIAGVGNIYASEALWIAGVHPTVPAASLGDAAVERVSGAVVEALRHAIDKGGTSLRDFVNGTGAKGENAPYLRVYGRADQPCQRCGTKIESFVLGGRATYCCPRCQPPPRRGKVPRS